MTEYWFEKVKYHALGDTPTIRASYDLAKQLIDRRIPGDFVECGVFAGAQAAMMARAIKDDVANSDMPRKVHLFDSFQGIPKAGPHDYELRDKPAGESSCSLDRVMHNMQAWEIPGELLVYHPGWIEETVPAAQLGQIAFLRLDSDLYSSTKVCMEHLYPKLSVGAWVCVDDFNLRGARQAVLEYFSEGDSPGAPAPIYWRIPSK